MMLEYFVDASAGLRVYRLVTEWPGPWEMHWQAQQQGVLRFNCADSLDRTNAASYFAGIQVLTAAVSSLLEPL